MSDPTKLGFLSLEFVVGEDTYWLTTGLGRGGYYFTQLPLSLFAGYPLIPHRLSNDADYSEITAYSDHNLYQTQNPDCHNNGPMKIATDLTSWPRLSWNELAARLIDAIPLKDQCGLWHEHVVKQINPVPTLNDVAYKVTAFLPPPDGEGVFAIFGQDYKLPENPNWRTFKEETEETFRQRLRQFKIEAVGINNGYWPADST